MAHTPTLQAHDAGPSGNDYYNLATQASSTRIEIPAHWLGKYVHLKAEGGAAHAKFGDDAVAVDETATTGVAAEVMTADGEEPEVSLDSGQHQAVRIPASGITHFAYVAAGTLRCGLWTGTSST